MLRKVVFLLGLALIALIALSPPANACPANQMQANAIAIEKAQATATTSLNPAMPANTKEMTATPAWWSAVALKHAELGLAVLAAAEPGAAEPGLRQNFPNPFNETDPANTSALAAATTDSATTNLTTALADTTAATVEAITYHGWRTGRNASELVAAGRYLGARGHTSAVANAMLNIAKNGEIHAPQIVS